MPNGEQSRVKTIPTGSVFPNDPSGSITQGNCFVQTNSSELQRDESLAGLTALEYRTLEQAYDYFNNVLFEGSLPQVLITLQRHHYALGYFSPKRFRSRDESRKHVHEVALNPDGFAGNTDKAILSILVHEMVHVWQQENGHPGRGRYHNREWARKMCSIGLMPSTTGRPGGAVTGEKVAHYILVGDEFDAACHGFLDKYRLVWESAVAGANGDSQDDSQGGAQDDDSGSVGDSNEDGALTRQTRTKFTCPNCGLNAWAKPDALMDCHQCSIEAHETVAMCPNYARPAAKRKLRIQSLDGGQPNARFLH